MIPALTAPKEAAMQNPTTPPAPEVAPTAVTGRELAQRFGDRWQIGQERPGVWSAERRSPDGHHIRFICAHSAAELAGKIEAAEAAER